MKTHLRISVEPLQESTTIQAECGFMVPNAYFPVIWEPGNVPEGLSTILFCETCWRTVWDYKSVERYMIYGVMERREAQHA